MAPATPAEDTRDRATVADETLLDALSAMTPEERLRWNDRMGTTVLELRHGCHPGGHHPETPVRRRRSPPVGARR
jgi:hypothetical protein